MKKFLLPVISLILIIIIVIVLLFSNTTKEITSTAEIEVIKQDSNLNLLVNLGNFSKENYSESKLLDVAMQYASHLNLMNELNNENTYLQYVNKDDLHNLIFELTALQIEAPIEIDDFYYLYDSENSYYYYLGVPPVYYEISKINKIERNNNKYFINCSIKKSEDGEITTIDNVLITLNFLAENNIIKYQVEEISIDVN